MGGTLMYKKSLFKQKRTITRDEFDSIVARSEHARYLLTSENVAFNREYFDAALQEIQMLFVENRVRDVQEVTTVSEQLKKIFFTPKKVQLDELSGQYKFIVDYKNWLSMQVQRGEELQREVENGKLIVKEVQ